MSEVFVVTDMEDHEDGSSTVEVELSEDTVKEMCRLGLKFLFYCAVAEISTEEALERVMRKET